MGQEKNISADGFLHAGGFKSVKPFTASKPTMVNVLPKATVAGTGTGYTQVGSNMGNQVHFTNQNKNLPIVSLNATPNVGVGIYNPITGADYGVVAQMPLNTMQGHLVAVKNTELINYLNQNSNPVSPAIPPVIPPVAPPQTGGGGGGGGGGDTSGGGEAENSQEEGQGESPSDEPIIDDSHDEISSELDEENNEEAPVQKTESDSGSYFAEGDSKMLELKNEASKENEVLASMGLRGITNGEIVLVSSIIVGLILIRIATK